MRGSAVVTFLYGFFALLRLCVRIIYVCDWLQKILQNKWIEIVLIHKTVLCVLLIGILDAANLLWSTTHPSKQIHVWEYSIQYLNIPSTRLVFTFEALKQDNIADYYTVAVSAKNDGIFSKLFKIDNQYETLIETDTHLPEYLAKKIDQKNIQQTWQIKYDQQNQMALIDSTRKWEIPEKCHNYFSMLFYLRSQPLKIGDKYLFNLDVEYLIWLVQAVVEQEEQLETKAGEFWAIKLKITYKPIKPQGKRPWKTDILTNRIAHNANEMCVWYSKENEHLLLRVDYDSQTKMILTNKSILSTE